MNIALLVPSLLPTGPVRVALDLRALFLGEGHTVNLFYFDDKPSAEIIDGSVKLSFLQKFAFDGFDVIHSHGLRPDTFIRLNRKRISGKTVTTLHNYVRQDLRLAYGGMTSKVFSGVWNWSAAKHNGCVVLSEDMKTYYSNFWKNKNLNVIYNTRVLEPQKNEDLLSVKLFDFKGKSVLLGSFCRVNERKGLLQVLELLTLDFHLKFALFGDGEYLSVLKQKAAELKVEDRVLWLGYNSEAFYYSHCFDVLVMPSISEGFPLALLEAVQLRVPVVSSAIAVLEEVFSEDEVLKFEFNDIAAFKKEVYRAIENKSDLTQKALKRFQENYSPEVVSRKYLDLYSSLLT